MMARFGLVARLLRDTRGSMVIETAFVVPTLALMSLGTFEVAAMVSRQNELQTAVAEAAQIALASKPDTQAKRDVIKGIIRTSTGLSASQVTITNEYRCDAAATLVATNTCTTSQTVTTYLKIAVDDTFTPFWTDYGVGTAFNYNVDRLVIVA